MSLNEILSDYKTWVAILAAAIGGLWVDARDKRKKRAAIGKDEAEADAIRYNTFLGKEKRQNEKEKEREEKIEELIKKLDFAIKELETCNQLKAELLLLNKELNAEKALWAAIKA